jgi:CheY-like chemotaxis protein
VKEQLLPYFCKMQRVDTVCIVDDDPIYVFTTKQKLQVGNFCNNILIYNNGKEAFEALKALIENNNTLPDVILLDLNMPVWDGWDFLDEFQTIKANKKIAIYIVSSSDNPDDIARSKSYHIVNDFIIKPITIEKLDEELSKLK